MTHPTRRIDTFTGTGANILKVSPQYQVNYITILTPTVGKVTIRGLLYEGTSYEKLINGKINLKYDRSLWVTDGQFEAFEFTFSEDAAYTVIIRQTDSIEGT